MLNRHFVPLILLCARVLCAQTPPAPPQPILLPVLPTSAGCIIQSDFGSSSHKNFETVILEGHDLVHYWRDNANTGYTWHRAQVITHNATGFGCIIQSNFKSGSHGNFEVVVPEGNKLVHYWHDNSDVTLPWQNGGVITLDATGSATMIQSDFGSGGHGNFEVVVIENHTLVHYFHDNSNVNNPWQRGQNISTQASGPGSIIQSNFGGGGHGNFEVAVPEGQALVHYFHDNSNVNNPWQRGQTISTSVTGPASLIQSNFGSGGHGNFELVVPEGANLVHHSHDNSNVNNPWQRGGVVASGVAGYSALIQSNFGSTSHGNFEVVTLHNQQIFHHFHDNSNVNNPWQQAQQITTQNRSQKVCQLTGGYDQEQEHTSVNQTSGRYQVYGTDLGYPFEHDGRVYFAFGDTGPNGEDSIAYTRDLTADNCVHLDFVANGNNFRPISIPGVSLKFFEVPTTGFSANGNLYLFAWTDHADQFRQQPGLACGPEVFSNQAGHAALARSKDDGATYQLVYQDLGIHFVYLSVAVVDNSMVSGLPQNSGKGLLIWGSGECYRASDVFLAYVPLTQVESKDAMLYYTGATPAGPRWMTSAQLNNQPRPPAANYSIQPLSLFSPSKPPCAGELSVDWNRNLGQWLMLYNCNRGQPNGTIEARVSPTPWGPWSNETTLFDPHADNGFCHFIHWNDNCDNVNDGSKSPSKGNAGDVYAPYIIPRYTEGGLHTTTIFFTTSTWNPYEVTLMRSTLALPSPLPYGPDTCKSGFVWRGAIPNDHVCVVPAIATATGQQNAAAAANREPNGGASGPDTCKPGFVWRGAFDGDHVCVTPQVRDQAAADNAAANGRKESLLSEGPIQKGPVMKKVPLP